MGGVEGVEEMTTEQIEATAGGELLRQEAASFTQVQARARFVKQDLGLYLYLWLILTEYSRLRTPGNLPRGLRTL